jgi:hypothetical protein
MFWPMKLLDLVISKKNPLIILSELTVKCKIFKKKANEIAGFGGSNLFS